jgi:hypothetical protein
LILRRGILKAAEHVKRAGRSQVLTQDVAKAVRTLPDLEVPARGRGDGRGARSLLHRHPGHFFNREVYKDSMTNLVKMLCNDDFEQVGSQKASAPAEPCSVSAGSGRRADRFLTKGWVPRE